MKTVTSEFVGGLINFAPTEETRKQGFAKDQLEGTVALYNMLARNRVAYLADEVGMGKTYVALGVMSLVRYFDPCARIIVIAPRENIQRKWVKELQNFVRLNWQVVGNRVKSLQGGPAWDPVVCESLLDFAHEALLHSDRDFFLRMTSFSLALKDPKQRRKLRRRLRSRLTWVDTSALSARTAEGFRDGFGAAINAAVPEADLVVVDEGHNLKHGFQEHGSIRNRVMGLAFGHPAGREFAGDWYGPRAKRLLLLSATPFEEEYAAIQRQLEVFGFGDAALSDASGGAPMSVRDLLDDDLSDGAKREIVGRLMVRRVSGLRIAGELHTKNMYRREWRMGGYEQHDEVMRLEDPRQRLVVALMQKKVAEILQDERFNNNFQIGMLSSFESFLESLGRSQHAARAAAAREDEEEGDDATRVFDGDQAKRPDERRGIDTDAIARVADSYRERFGGSLPHPKLDATAAALADVFETGEKALVFVRRVRTVDELGAKLDRYFDGWIRARMEAALPELKKQIAELFVRYERESEGRGGAEPLGDSADGGDAEPEEQLEDRHLIDEDDEGSTETFFSWFFRGEGPKGVLSGAAFQKNRLAGQGSVYTTLFEEDFVSWLLDRPADPLQALADRLGDSRADTVDRLRRHAFHQFNELSQRASGYPRYVVYEAYQIAGLGLLAQLDDELADRAQAVLGERYQGATARPMTPPEGFPGPEVGIGITTFFTELAHRPELRARLWPEERVGDFRQWFRRSEQRRELLSAMARLGAAYIDLYLLAIRDLGSFALRREADTLDAAPRLALAFLDLLEKQMNEPGFHAYRELASASEAFDLLMAVNFPEVPTAPLHKLASLYSATLQRQVPVGRMAGGVNKRLVRQFRLPGFPLVLASTDVLQEGEDLHTFCRRVVHYGITWTPSAMEQRTGRIDRIGSLVQRELDGTDEHPNPEEWIQVFYPHLSDTVEVLQVRRVLKRLNRFFQLIHKRRSAPADVTSRIDAAREILVELETIKPIEGPLESAFPVERNWLGGELSAQDIEMPDVDAQLAHLERLWEGLVSGWRVEPIRCSDPLVREGTAAVERGRLAAAGSRANATQRFDLVLRSQAAGDATLLRCRSAVGRLDLRDDAALDALYELQIASGHAKVCVEPDLRSRDDIVFIQHDILFHPNTTQLEECVALVERTAAAAKRIHDDLVFAPAEEPKRRRKGDRRKGGAR